MARNRLDVWLEACPSPVGALFVDSEGAIGFRYAEAYLDRREAPPLSLALPVREQPYGDVQCRAFFDNLLPENDLLSQVMDREGIGRDDLVGLLHHLGADCPGSVSCLPAGSPPVKTPGDLTRDYDALADADLVEIVRRLADREPLPANVRDPSPVAGVRRKIALTLLPDGRFALPREGVHAPTTHILKAPGRGRGREALLEEVCAFLADGCGLTVSRPEHRLFGDADALLITRFDRTIGPAGMIHRLHQEDFAQALGLPARLKYQRNGAPGRMFDAEAIAGLLARTREPARARDAFLAMTMVNLLIGNTDNHAKNHALLYDQGPTPVLAPFYDLTPVMLDASVTHQLAFDIGAAQHAENLRRTDLEAFLATFGLTAAGRRRFLDERVAGLVEAMEALTAELAGVKDLDDLIGRETEQLVDAIGLKLAIRSRDFFAVRQGGWASDS
jgi:serine/threonine-protein kinase HipA